MQILQAPRASAILYSILIAGQEKRPWLLPANICPIVPVTFLKARLPFKFVDISARTLHMDLDQAEALIKERKFGGLLYAHTYGEASTPNDFFESIKKDDPEFTILDDRCLCVPDLQANPVHQADIQLYSTGYAKIAELHVGGYAFAPAGIDYQPAHAAFNPQHYEELEASYKRAVAQRAKFVYRDSDWLDTGSPVLPWDIYRQQIEINLAQSLAQRAALNQIYASLLPREIQLAEEFQIWRFNIRVKNKQRILDRIFSSGLFASSHYASLADIMGDAKAPYADELAKSVINLFNDHHFTPAQAEQACKIILENLA
ncbi:MAG TPA: hypothetical protein VLE49_16600 [Anaerolineales bacterium]|nr:hypothetical protein [Anaerolineales bacterium]